MKNRKIPGFPSPEDQDTIKFYLFKKLSYTSRMLLYLGCIIFGLLLQIIMVSVFPGAIILIFASLLILVKGLSAMPTPASKRTEGSWVKTNMEKVHQIKQVKQSINKWDKDALDISNGLGCVTFILVFIVIFFIYAGINAAINGTVAGIFIVDSIILIASIWFNGMRTKGQQQMLYIKTDMVVELEKHFEKIKKPGENYVPSMILTKDKDEKEFPTDCRFNIIFDNVSADFYGILAQININDVSGTNYPYFYCVITAKNGYGLGKYTNRLVVPKGITVEFSKDEGAEVIVIRQITTKNSGYHTNTNACNDILEFSLSLARKVLGKDI